METGLFDDVIISAIVNWTDSSVQTGSVTNEIDVVAVRGIQPLFISCKTCEVKTEALNELAVLRDRFGGEGSRAMVVTSAGIPGAASPTRRRASELGIEIVDWNDLKNPEKLKRRIAGS